MQFVFECPSERFERFVLVSFDDNDLASDGIAKPSDLAHAVYRHVCGGEVDPIYRVAVSRGTAVIYVDGLGHYTARVRVLRVPWDDPRLVMARAVVDRVLSEAGKYVANAIRGSGVKLTIRRVRRILSELGFTREPTKYTYLLIALLLMSAGYRVSLIGNNRRTKAIVAFT